MRPPISEDVIDEMFDAYIEKASAPHVSKKCGVGIKTAQKYISLGDPKRGIKPFKVRGKAIREKVEKSAEEKASLYRNESLGILREFKGKVWKALREIEKFDPDAITPTQFMDMIEKIAKIEQFLCGQAETITRTENVITHKVELPDEVLMAMSTIALKHLQEKADKEAQAVAYLESGDVVEVEGNVK